MRDALLVADDQRVSKGFLALTSVFAGAGANSIRATQTLEGYRFVQRDASLAARTEFSESPHTNGTTIAVHLSQVRNALRDLEKLQRRARREIQFRQEMQWLAENRHGFSGQWIALQGERLLAVGATAREVFSQVADQAQPPLVVRVDDDQLPFAGW